MVVTDETLKLARTAAADLRRKGEAALADAVENLVEASQPDAVPTPDYLTPSQAGSLLRVTGQTIKDWVHAGKLDGFQFEGRIVVPRAAVEAYLRRARGSLDLEDVPDAEAAALVVEGRS